MKLASRYFGVSAMAAMACLSLSSCSSTGPVTEANAANVNAGRLAAEARSSLGTLYATNPKARQLGSRAKGILVFPNIYKGGFMLGAMGGNGALIRPGGAINEFYQTAGLSYGLQAGAQKYGYALFLMDDVAFDFLRRRDGWEIGSHPGLVVVDRGVAGNLSTTTIDSGTYAFFFDQTGLMAGLGLQGSKITRIYPRR